MGARPTYAPSAFRSPSTFADVPGAVVSASPPPLVTVGMPCIA